MSILSNIIAEVDKRQKESNSKSQLYDLEKTIREMAKSKGLMPRNFLIKIAEQNPKIANNRIIQHLIGEQDVPTQKGRDAKPAVLTKQPNCGMLQQDRNCMYSVAIQIRFPG